MAEIAHEVTYLSRSHGSRHRFWHTGHLADVINYAKCEISK